MTIRNLFNQKETQESVERINTLSPATKALRGKMNVTQMLAHCNVAYEITYTAKHPKPKGFEKFMIKLFAKNAVVGLKPYPKNERTAPVFLITDEGDFELEKQNLLAHLHKTQQLGASHFNGKENAAFGCLTENAWNTLFSKHLDHHLRQFGV